MAKQTGLYGIRGKVGEYKYYGMKGVDGTIMAKQNEGMSERVKTSPEYDNTRRNNFEFGMATSTAGAISKAFSQKWRYLLVPFATAKIARELLAAAKLSDSVGWGDRTLGQSALNDILAPTMQKFVKNDVQDFSPISISIQEVEEVMSLVAMSENLINEKAAAAGCDGVRCVLCVSDVKYADGGYSEKSIGAASCVNQILGTADVSFGEDLNITVPAPTYENSVVVSLVMLPYRTIGTEKYIMQEFCSAYFVHPTAA